MRALTLLGLAAVLAVTAGCGQGTGASAGPAAPAPGTSPSSASPSTSPSPSPTPEPTPVVQAGDGALTVVPGTTVASGPGEAVPYVVEVEGGLGVGPAQFAADVDAVLSDPRSWGAGGRLALHRVDTGHAAVRVALVSPRTVDRLCAPLQTNGYFSCANGDRAVLNVARWLTGAPAYAGQLTAYRQYLVNHEVGHLFGRGHEPCPGPGQPAPVMMQQTKGLQGCTAVSWPYP